MRQPLAIFAAFLLFCFGASTAAAVQTSPCEPQRWAPEMAAFEKQDAQSPPPKRGLLFVGSSSIRLWDLEKSFPELPAINRGFGGSQLCDSVHHAELLVLKHQPAKIVVYAGDNDIAAGKSPEQVAGDFQALVATVRAALPRTPIIYIAIKPSIARWKLAEKMKRANKLIEAQCAKNEGLHFVDVWRPMLGDDGQPRRELFRDDGLHLNDAGYALWAELVKPMLLDAAK
ncbi:MAG: hypothetical protein DCC67_00835 [Planctomycetota bacterium]|nr:MAG: hypothetical protein DCC67_00835 [Planctomycetota bacterium]